MELADVLYGAADHLRVFGHNKGDGFANPNSIYSASCAHGALAASLHNYRGADREELREAAKVALRRQIGCDLITIWNDAPQRTADEVIEAFCAAALVEAAKSVDVSVVVAPAGMAVAR